MSKSIALYAKGGSRKGAGRKSDLFKSKCMSLASSPKFFTWAEKVFNGEAVSPKTTIDGRVILIEATPGDKIYLWEKLAAYGFGKPTEFDSTQLIKPLQDVINKTTLLQEMYALSYPERISDTKPLGSGGFALQT